jgi:hypothetical protein
LRATPDLFVSGSFRLAGRQPPLDEAPAGPAFEARALLVLVDRQLPTLPSHMTKRAPQIGHPTGLYLVENVLPHNDIILVHRHG